MHKYMCVCVCVVFLSGMHASSAPLEITSFGRGYYLLLGSGADEEKIRTYEFSSVATVKLLKLHAYRITAVRKRTTSEKMYFTRRL